MGCHLHKVADEMKKWYLICSVLVLVITFESIALLSLNEMYNSLASDHASTKVECEALRLTYENLTVNYNYLETDYTKLRLQYDCLQIDFAVLQSNYSALEAKYTAIVTNDSDVRTLYYNLSIQFEELKDNYTTLENQYNQLISNYTVLENELNELETNYSLLQAVYQNLQENYTDLEARYSSLESNFTSLQTSYQTLQNQYSLLLSNYSTLEESHETLETQYKLLQELYDALRAEYDRYATAYQNLRNMIDQRSLKTDIESFITPPNSDVVSVVYSITGGWSNSSDWNEYWSDVKGMYMWVRNNIEYRYDGLYPILPYDPASSLQHWNEMWQFPNETLSLKKGDCEDQAILLCSMIRCYCDMEYEAECIWITSSESGHVGVQIPVTGHTMVIFDPAGGYYSHDLWGNVVFNDVAVEINNWLNYWKPTMGNDVYVYRVFSDYIDRSFTSTDEYITWMYSR